MALRIYLLLAVVAFSVGEEELFERCLHSDLECLKRQPLIFLSRTYAGYPKLGIEPIDPLIVTSTDVNLDNDTGVAHFKNINITGFKDSKLAYTFQVTTAQQTQTMEAEITIFSDVELELTKSNKTCISSYYAKSTVRGKSVYRSDTKDVDGKHYQVMGPETTTCEVLGEPTVTIRCGLQRALDQDEDAVKLKRRWEANTTTLHNKIICEIANNGFTAFMKNLRSLLEAYDVSKFLYYSPNFRPISITDMFPIN